ncbi:hypothetical protein EDC01DRAFT_608941 [Geopyxis carbonaria]|nr:hypothetical protein EDC01DRAFT_608941 [Geopyxis carbonaria]
MKSVNNSGFGSTFGRIGGSGLSSFSTRISKIPGMLEAPWPVKGTSHIRGITIETKRTEGAPVSTERKLKNSLISISADESVFGILRKKLGLGELKKNISSHDYAEREYRNVPPEVRVPERVVLTGSQLQEMIRTRVNTRLPHPNAVKEENDGLESDSESDMALNRTQVHPMLRRLYERLRTELTPFDEHKCETTPWETKYAPMKTEEVLQSGRELSVFAAWLTELKTDKLDIPTSKSGKRKAKREGSGPKGGAKKKRKKKRVVEDDGLGGFVINSEEEEDLMDEISDPEEEDWTNQNDKVKKSTIRSGDKFNNLDELFATPKDSKKTNAVLISGPTGCGKTAAVYAVAKELGYVVFEISPGTRRNGKDLLDQVGDMSRNHLVHQQKNQSAQQDNPFSITKAVKHKEQTLENDTQVHQQQSLILLEEVDILFEEDKTFWTSVMTLMSKSKRPIVMTCNDESLVPIDTLSLHAILRFSMPNRDLVVDKLLLVCANEGHILQRPAVDALVKTNKGDIRSSLMDLQIHCRMGVGDRTGSLGWQLIRWPIGSDIAENGERMRVVSVDTYQSGMGMIDNSQDAKVKDKWEDVWREYDIDIGSSSLGLQECAWDIQSASVSKKVSLPITDAFFEARSAADAFAGHAMLCIDEPKLDYTLPERNNISKLDDLQGISVVQTDRLVIPGSVETDMSIYMRYLARKYLSKELQKVSVKLQPISHDEIVNAVIRRNETDWLSRMDYQALFTPLSKLEAVFASTMPTAHSSIFPAMYKLAVEISPWVRFIIRNDIKLEKQRRDTGKLLSAGGKQRTTRAARLALAGGSREKKERWLRGLGANVLKSAGENWDEGVLDAEGDDDDVDMLSPDSSC